MQFIYSVWQSNTVTRWKGFETSIDKQFPLKEVITWQSLYVTTYPPLRQYSTTIFIDPSSASRFVLVGFPNPMYPAWLSPEGKKRRKIKIPSALELEIEGMTGSDTNKESKVVNPAFAVAPDYDPIIARSTKHTYRDHGLEWDNTGRNSFYSRFTYTP